MHKYLLEACVESFQQCLAAEARGANRIELCADLDKDGLTPSVDLIKEVSHKILIPARVMIRPRAGNFIYSPAELREMKSSIEICKKIGVEGVVFGICTNKRQLDIAAIATLVLIAKPLKITIHKAIDTCDNPLKELEKLSLLGVDSVLTSGKADTALSGIKMIQQMVKNAGEIELIACGKVTDQNIEEIHRLVAAPAYHGKKIVGELPI